MLSLLSTKFFHQSILYCCLQLHHPRFRTWRFSSINTTVSCWLPFRLSESLNHHLLRSLFAPISYSVYPVHILPTHQQVCFGRLANPLLRSRQPQLFTHSADSFITGGNLVGQMWFTLSKSILGFPSHLLSLCVPENSFHEGLLHGFLGNRSGSAWPVVSGSFCLFYV